jgi:hypothetical protein
VPTPSFCIDVSRDITAGETLTNYNYINLSLAPLTPAGPMGSSAATDIEKLWAEYYTAASTNNVDAAALQVAIWEDIATDVGTYTISLNGTDPAVTNEATIMLDNLPNITDEASLEGLVSTNGQNYVVPFVEPVPEPTTAGCFLLGLGTLACCRRFNRNRSSENNKNSN